MSDSLPRWMRRIPTTSGETPEAVPAATVVLLRDAPDAGLETLMVRRSSKLEFAGGMWVFPGGRVDPGDVPSDDDVIEAARRAAVREAREEADLVVDADALVPFAHWVPPPVTAKRFATWFFLGPAPEGAVTVDMGEIRDHRWISPADAITRRDAEEIELAPPTWVTLHRLAGYEDVAAAVADAGAREPEFFETHIARIEGGVAALWEGDAGYDTNDGGAPGARHRLWMLPTGWRYERTEAD
ncbi:MAG TPA: NUDIX domain-containing protein [Acidimicrobiia bacterium]|nr:NUDIX domain-containing protein [Acidimicrobiia bacterium]